MDYIIQPKPQEEKKVVPSFNKKKKNIIISITAILVLAGLGILILQKYNSSSDLSQTEINSLLREDIENYSKNRSNKPQDNTKIIDDIEKLSKTKESSGASIQNNENLKKDIMNLSGEI